MLLLVALAAAMIVGTPQGVRAQLVDPAATSAKGGGMTRSAIHVADSLYGATDVAGALEVLRGRLEVAPDDFEAMWRGARAALTLGILTEDRDAKLRWLQTAAGFGEGALALRPHDATSLAWAAATKGRLAMDDHTPRTTARLGKEVWALTGALLDQRPDDPMGNAIRGKLIQEVRRLSWLERTLARLLLGMDVVAAATWADAEKHLQMAVAGDPGMVLYHLDLGDTYRLQGKSEQALATYRRGLAVEERLPVDAYYKRRIQDGMRALGRDGRGGP